MVFEFRSINKIVTLCFLVMKKMVLTICISIFAVISVLADGFVIQNYLGVNCLTHDVSTDETFYQISRRYFVRPSTLAVVNNVTDIGSVVSGNRLFIPLTETNFYTTKGLESSKFTFKPVYYKVEREKTLDDVAAIFYINPANLAEWNAKGASKTVDQGDRLTVGWVKYEKNLAKTTPPAYIQKEKIVFGNTAERIEAREFLRNKKNIRKEEVIATNEPTKKVIPARKVEVNEVVENESPPIKDVDPINKEKVTALKSIKNKASKSGKDKYVLKEAKIRKRVKPKSTIKVTEIKPRDIEKITKKESEFLESDKKDKTKKVSVISKLKNWTKNSYRRTKLKTEVDNNSIKTTVKKNKDEAAELPEKIIKKQVVKTSPNNSDVNTKEKIENKPNELIDNTQDKPLFLENKLQRLTLLKSMKGRSAFFYSGNAGAKFYSFTNLSGKGSVIKVTNLENGRYILAEVVGPLPETDRKRGYIIKLSNNSKLILGSTRKSFSVKVNY